MTDRTVRLIATASDARPAAPGTEQVVLDTAWTPAATDRSDLRSARPLIGAALAAHQPLAEAIELIDGWAARAGLVERLEVDGFSHWYRRRIAYWRWLHDRLIWRWVLAGLAAERPIDRLELGAEEVELAQVAHLAGAAEGWAVDVAPPAGVVPSSAPARQALRPPVVDRIRNRLRAPVRRASLAARIEAMAERTDRLGATGDGVLVLTDPAVHQAVTVDGLTARVDPFLGPVVEALRATRLPPVVLELGARTADDLTWAGLQAADRERTLPGSILADLFADPADEAAAAAAARAVTERLAGDLPALDVAGLDLGPTITAELREYARTGLVAELRQAARIGRLLARLRPAAIVLINEYSRPEWIVAARRQGIPIAAVQHGIIHPLHAGYVLPARPSSLALVDRTYVFGAYEARLLTEGSVYRPAEVKVSGAPRLDLRAARSVDADERAAIRAELGVAPGARLIVFSSTSSAIIRRTVVAAALDAVMDRAWPAAHLVVKLHPAEDDGGFYPALVEGLARARGFEPPPTTIVKEIDLLRLLAAADAHLGVYSTVLTDAVTVGTPNLIVTSLSGSDLLGYVQAGVARPVRTGSDLLAALERPVDPAAEARARTAFLADHFADGPAATRIVADLLAGFASPLRLRAGVAADAELLLEWANDPVTRAASFHSATISPADHERWLAERLASPATTLWIGELDGRPIGQVRIELDPAGTGEVGISVAPLARGSGVGRRLLNVALLEASRSLPVNAFVARVRPENEPSLALFRAAGFVDEGPGTSAGVPCLVLRAPARTWPGAVRAGGPVRGSLRASRGAAR